MNLDCRWLGTSVIRIRLIAAGMTLVVAGLLVLGLGSRSLQTAAKAGAQLSEAQLLPGHTLAMASLPSANQSAVGALPGAHSQARDIYAGLPLMFEPNQGQANLDLSDPRSKFVARGSGYSLLLGSEGAILQLRATSSSKQKSLQHSGSGSAVLVESLQMRLAGANPNPRLAGTDLLPGKSNYLLGNDPAKWRRGVPQFARVRYEDVYPGINLVFYGNQGHLEYDFQVAPGSDPAQAELEFDGAKQLELKDGALLIRGENGSVRLEAPRVYQEIAGREQPVEGSFVLRGANRAGFTIGAYDRARELVIDPELEFSTYFGGSLDEQHTSVALDSSNNIYLTGSTDSPNLATPGVFQGTLHTTSPATNVYIAKIMPPQGSNQASLAYVTYLGGSGSDSPVGIGVDSAGNAYVAGTTTSTNFPTTLTGYQTAPESSGNQHVFVSELDSLAASLKYSSYLSGNGVDIASGMTIDSQGNIYVTGTTSSVETLTTDQFPATNLPQPLPFQSFPRYAAAQFFVTKVNTSANTFGSIAYSTYFGGGAFEGTTPVVTGGGIAVDTNGNIYFTGTTNFTYTGCAGCSTTDFPILDAYQPCLDQPPPTVVVNPPTCTNTSTTSNPDAFVAKFANPSVPQNAQAGAALLQWSTYLGGSQTDSGTGIALDPSGAANVYVTGTTNSQDFVASSTINTLASYQKCLNNLPPTTTTGTVTCTKQTDPAPSDAYVARLSNPTTSGTTITNVSLTYFSYLGGSANEQGLALTVDAANGALVTGWTQSTNFPVFPPNINIQTNLNPTQDAFIARLNTAAAVTGQTTQASWATYFGGHGIGEGTGITLDTNENVYLAGDTNAADLRVSDPLPVGGSYNGGYDAFVTQFGTVSSLSITGVLTLGTNQTYISAGNQATFTYTLTNSGPDLAYNITVTDNLLNAGLPLALNSASATSGTCTSPGSSSTNVSCSIQSLQAGSTATVTIVVTPAANASGSQAQFNGGTVTANAPNNITPATTSVPAQMSDYGISVSPANVTVAAGNTASFQVQLTPHPVYGSGITLSVSGLPTAGTQATFTTPTVTLQGTSPATTTLNISTTARPITTPTGSLWTRPFYAIWLSFPGLALLGIGSDRRRRRIAGILLLGLISIMLLLQPACSHTTTQPPVSGTPAGNYTLTVAAAAGSDTKNYGIVLNVQ